MGIDERHLRLFPAPEEVFADPVDLYAKHLLPLVSVNLQAFDGPDEWVHVVHPAEVPSYDQTEEYWTEACCENLIGFDVVDGRYKLRASFDFFYTHSQSDEEFVASMRGVNDDLLAAYAEAKRSGVKSDWVLIEDAAAEDYEFDPLFVVDGCQFGVDAWIAVAYDREEATVQLNCIADWELLSGGLRPEEAQRHAFSDGRRYWEIKVDGCQVVTTIGRLGTKGRSKVRRFPSADEAQLEAKKQRETLARHQTASAVVDAPDRSAGELAWHPLPTGFVEFVAAGKAVDFTRLNLHEETAVLAKVSLCSLPSLKLERLRCGTGILKDDLGRQFAVPGFYTFEYVSLTSFGERMLVWWPRLGCFGQCEGVDGAHNFALEGITWEEIVLAPERYLVGSFCWNDAAQWSLIPDHRLPFEPCDEDDQWALERVGKAEPFVA